jgi:transcriptional regulator with XRE-family HTH domain
VARPLAVGATNLALLFRSTQLYPIGYDPAMDIAFEIEAARRRARLTQAELAERAGTSQATVSAYEAGRKTPSAETFARLLAACGARLAVHQARSAVRSPPLRERERRGQILAEVIELAEVLPARHSRQLRLPPLRDLVDGPHAVR